MPYMAWFRETLLLAEDVRLDALIERSGRYRLSLLRAGVALVEYWNDGDVHRRRVGERTHDHEFRSIEQLRYEFERDAEDALRPR